MKKINLALKNFKQYTNNYDIENEDIRRKILHSYRVMNNCIYIAKSLNFTSEKIFLIQFIGLYHDIARFEQYRLYHTYNDLNSFDHGDYALKILKEEKFIEQFTDNEFEKRIIYKAIKNHNKYKLEDDLSEEELLYVKIIRDADKLDIMYESIEQFFKSDSIKKEIENGTISSVVMNEIIDNKTILRKKESSLLEKMLVYVAFIFDLNFKYSFKYIEENKYVDKILNQFSFSKSETAKKIKLIQNIIQDFIVSKV